MMEVKLPSTTMDSPVMYEAEVKGRVLTTKTTQLERMYRGNTSYPIGRPKSTQRKYASRSLAQAALQSAIRRLRSMGYAVC